MRRRSVAAGLGRGQHEVGVAQRPELGHVDPNMSYWTTSGEFVFITILSGAGSVVPAFIGSLVFESVRSFAFAVLPQLWQMLLGSVLLLTILFLPQGLGSLIARMRWRRNTEAP